MLSYDVCCNCKQVKTDMRVSGSYPWSWWCTLPEEGIVRTDQSPPEKCPRKFEQSVYESMHSVNIDKKVGDD